jgi:transposase InsO family protein
MSRLIERIVAGVTCQALLIHRVAGPRQLEPSGAAPAEFVLCDLAIDITYVPTDEGWLYAAVLLDACSRRVVGWAMADHLRTELALDALTMALARRRPAAGEGGLVHHTDRGCQYTAERYQAVLAAHGVRGSMSRAGNCLDNAMAESFFATLKGELIDRQRWPTRAAARRAIFEWIEVFYNRQRRHSALGYLSPAAFEECLAGAIAA